ncbi:MAG: hypothetical protein CML42_06475 [Rhodobacteraceae bacterium]|nr:hypothetical protein [Paracoccaceae bacterium]
MAIISHIFTSFLHICKYGQKYLSKKQNSKILLKKTENCLSIKNNKYINYTLLLKGFIFEIYHEI